MEKSVGGRVKKTESAAHLIWHLLDSGFRPAIFAAIHGGNG
jgi:hypothetical protein